MALIEAVKTATQLAELVQEWRRMYVRVTSSLRRGQALLLKLRAPHKGIQSAILQRAVAAHGTRASVAYLQSPCMPDAQAPRQLSDCILDIATASKLADKASKAAGCLLLELLAHTMALCTAARDPAGSEQFISASSDPSAITKSHPDAVAQALECALLLANCVEGTALGSEVLARVAEQFHLTASEEELEAWVEVLSIEPSQQVAVVEAAQLLIEQLA